MIDIATITIIQNEEKEKEKHMQEMKLNPPNLKKTKKK
jgi:hypothetical protein